jgi:hypothetical protein
MDPHLNDGDQKRHREVLDGAHSAKDSHAMALECLCKMLKLLDGDFAKQVFDAGAVRCLVTAMFGCDARRAMEARDALLCLHDKLPSGYASNSPVGMFV